MKDEGSEKGSGRSSFRTHFRLFFIQIKNRALVRKMPLVLTKQLFSVFDEADEYDDAGAHKADKEHGLKNPHRNSGKEHTQNCSAFLCARGERGRNIFTNR